MKKIILKIKDMTCASCALSIVKNLERQDGIISAEVNSATGKANIEYDESKINLDKIKEVIINTGYRIDEGGEKDTSEEHAHGHDNHISGNEKNLKMKVILSVIFSIPILSRMIWKWEVPGIFLSASNTDWVQFILATIVVFIFGWQFHKKAFQELKHFRTNMDSLISLGTLAAFFYSSWAMFVGGFVYFESAAAITSLILLGRFFEMKTKNRASRAMEKLMELGAKKARVLENGKEVEKSIDEIKVGDIIVVRAGEKVSLDGEIIGGESSLDESMLTGESLPVYKKIGDQIYGGTINKDGLIQARVVKAKEETMLAQIIKTVEEAQSFKPPMQRLADKIASIFVPVVIFISFLTFVGWFLATGDFSIAIINAVAVLIISCPCALGIATPIAVMVGTSVGAKNGILIKGGDSFEKAKDIDIVVFDKTGTLTKGEPSVQDVIINKELDFSEDKITKIAVSLSSKSDHPISLAINKFASKQKNNLVELNNFKEISGQGLAGECPEHKKLLLLGNLKLLSKFNIEASWAENILQKNNDFGGTIVFLAHGQYIVVAFLIADEIRENVAEAVKRFKELSIQPMMISGDNKYTAKTVAQNIGIENYLAEVLPKDKQREIINLQKKGYKVVFVGDGINDAPSLVQADLGIAMGGGTDIAKESGSIIIVKNDPMKILDAVKLSKKTFSVIKQNLFWAFFYNVLAIPLAVFGFVNPMVGAIAMSFSDITVISNSLRIYKK